MLRRIAVALVTLVIAAPAAFAVKAQPYKNAVFIEQHSTAAGQGKGSVCYSISVLVNREFFVTEQCVNMPWNAFVPGEFAENGDVQVRIEGAHLFILRPNGKEVRAVVTKRVLIKDDDEIARLRSGSRENNIATYAGFTWQ